MIDRLRLSHGAIYLCEEIMNEGIICAHRVNISGVTLGCKMN